MVRAKSRVRSIELPSVAAKGCSGHASQQGITPLRPKHIDSTKEEHHQAMCLKVTALSSEKRRSILSQVSFHVLSIQEAKESARHFPPFLL